jgi:O-antigen/teichoic acid export membrane protein
LGNRKLSVIKRAGRNILLKAAAELLSRFIYMFFFIYMARKLGASDFGLFSFAFSFAGIFAILIDPGLNLLITRDVARDKTLTEAYGNNIMGLKLVLSVITFFLVWISLRLIGYDNNTTAVVLVMGIFLIINAILDFFIAVTDAHEKMGIGANIKIINKLLVSILGAAVLYSGSRLFGLINWMVAGSILSAVISIYIIKKHIATVKISLQWHFIKRLLQKALPVALTIVFTTVYFKIDIVMLSIFGVNNKNIGFYSAAVKLIEI